MKPLLLTLMLFVPSMASAQSIPELPSTASAQEILEGITKIIGGDVVPSTAAAQEILEGITEIIGGDVVPSTAAAQEILEGIIEIIGGDVVLSTPNAQAIAERISGNMAGTCGETYQTLLDYRRAELGREIQSSDVFSSPRDGEACEVTRRDMRVYRCRYNVAWNARPRAIFLETDASGTSIWVRRALDTPARNFHVPDCAVSAPVAPCFDPRPRPGVLEELERLREAEKQRAVAKARQDYQSRREGEKVALSMVANVESDYRQVFSLYTENGCDGGMLRENDRILNPKPLTRGRPDF